VTGVIDDSGPPEGVLLSENEGYWEDYRLLTALRRQGKDQLVDELLAAFRRNEPPAALRLKALDGGGYPSGR
jgi:hypothetical protein